MKKYVLLTMIIFTSFVTCFFNSTVVNATTTEELKEQWYDTRYYPIYQGNEDNEKHNYADILDILNPPLDLLLSMSTEELAKLMQDYPCMGQMTTYFDTNGNQDYETFYMFCELNSDIFYELLRREDGITCLLEEYRTHELDVEKLNSGEYSTEIDQMWLTEIFGCQFIRYYAHHFTDNEYSLASQIIEEKRELYTACNDTLLYYFDLPEIEPSTEEKGNTIRTNYLRPDEIQEKEDKLAEALLLMKSKEDSLQTASPNTENSISANQEDSEIMVTDQMNHTVTESKGYHLNTADIITFTFELIVSLVTFLISYFQFKEKGFLFNNAYLYASKRERETMNKKPHYRQSAIVFLLLGLVFLFLAVEVILTIKWLYLVVGVIIVVLIIYAIASSINIERINRS